MTIATTISEIDQINQQTDMNQKAILNSEANLRLLIREEMAGLRVDMAKQSREQLCWLILLMVWFVAIIITVIKFS